MKFANPSVDQYTVLKKLQVIKKQPYTGPLLRLACRLDNGNENPSNTGSNEFCITRAKSLDWLSQVCSLLSLYDVTFFHAATICEKVIQKFQCELSVDDLHLITIASLMLSVKYNEVKQFSMSTYIKKIGHQKYTKETLLAAELFILKKLNFKLPSNSFEEFVEMFLNSFAQQAMKNEESENALNLNEYKTKYYNNDFGEKFKKTANIIYKVSMLSYKFTKACRQSTLFVSIMHLTFLVLGQNCPDMFSFDSVLFFRLSHLMNVAESKVLSMTKKIENYIYAVIEEDQLYLGKELSTLIATPVQE